MGFWQHFWAWVRLKPMPLSEEWQNLTLDLFKSEAKSPVQLTKLTLTPEPMLMRRHISALYMKDMIQQIIDNMYFFSSNQGREICGFMHLNEGDEEQFYGTVNIIWTGTNQTGNNNKYKPGLSIRSPHDISPAQEQGLRRVLETMLHPLRKRPDVGFNLEFKISPAHPKWKKPEKFQSMEF